MLTNIVFTFVSSFYKMPKFGWPYAGSKLTVQPFVFLKVADEGIVSYELIGRMDA
jgi:hypothetical protein